MFLDKEGRLHGSIGGGNVEFQALKYAPEAKHGEIRKYNLSNQGGANLGMICGGEVEDLIIASGDMPTFFTGLDMYYPTGRSAAIEDEVIVDLADYLEECAPDYMNYLDTVPGLLRNMTTDDGEVPFIAPKAATNYSGLSIRQDWLDIVGMDIPQTYDELEAVLAAFKSELDRRVFPPLSRRCRIK